MVPLYRRQHYPRDVAHLVLKDGRVIDPASGCAETVVLDAARVARMGQSIIAITPGSKLRLRALRPSTVS
jgi:hypothetical protein